MMLLAAAIAFALWMLLAVAGLFTLLAGALVALAGSLLREPVIVRGGVTAMKYGDRMMAWPIRPGWTR